MTHKYIFRGIIGSRAWGIPNEDSDTDYLDIIISPPEKILFHRPANTHSHAKDDHRTIDFAHVIKQLCKHNWTYIEYLYGAKPTGDWPLWHRTAVEYQKYFSKGFVSSAIGYAQSLENRGMCRKSMRVLRSATCSLYDCMPRVLPEQIAKETGVHAKTFDSMVEDVRASCAESDLREPVDTSPFKRWAAEKYLEVWNESW